MKTAFTMMEIVITIVILGILASIAAPKMFATRQTAEIVKLKEQVQAIRQGIEAYAGNQYIEKGFKKYPSTLSKSNIADEVVNGISKRGADMVGWDIKDDVLYYVTKAKTKEAVFFAYNPNNGEFKCDTSKKISGWKAEPCTLIGE